MSNEYKDWLEDLKNAPIGSEDHDRWIFITYPWMNTPGLYPEEKEYNFLNDVPEGWVKAFGQEWLDEIQSVYEKMNDDEKKMFKVLQLKEKFGIFTQYFSFTNDEISDIIEKYEEKSTKTCRHCGEPAYFISTGWISPWCVDCAFKIGGYFNVIGRNQKIFIEKLGEN